MAARTKAFCPRGGGHEAAGFNFVLPHNVPQTHLAQTDWRFCHKCVGLFFDGRGDKGFVRGAEVMSRQGLFLFSHIRFFRHQIDRPVVASQG